MAPIVKENETLTTGLETAARPVSAAADAGGKTPAVALEVPVSVNGARAVEGSDKREPFSETTKTVLVFGGGAVIRLQSPVAPGQLLFLTNEKTKKEVVCQVVKSRNYRNVSGYVELEFTEPVVGFWGMRFPSDRIVPQPAAAESPAAPQIAKPAAPASSGAALPKAPPKVDAAANFNALKALVSSPADADLQRVTGTSVVPPPTPKAPPATKPAAPVASGAETEALKLQTARLQEQLSSMLFSEKPSPTSLPEPPVATKNVHETAATILEFVKPEPLKLGPAAPSAAVEFAAPASIPTPSKPAPRAVHAPLKSTLDDEEVKIPSWLEPLARNAASASAAEETRVKADPTPQREQPLFVSDLTSEPVADSAPPEPQAVMPAFGASFLEPEAFGASGATHRSNKGIAIGAAAAGLLVAAAGLAWYLRNQGAAQASAPSAMVATAATIPSPAQSSPTSALQNPSSSAAGSVANPSAIAPLVPAAALTPNPGKALGSGAVNASANNAVVKVPQPAPAQSPDQVQVQPPVKKPALGQVRLAAPKVRGNGRAISTNADEPGIALNNAAPSGGDAFSAGLAANSKQPMAPVEPLPVGGDVRPAKLLNSVSPVYPSLAKSQHVAGDVRVDALIDANGRVTTMKVVSGPTLLHQAAMDALRQWKYQPATLDGKPVSMHLTVTLQFRLQ